MSSLIKTAKLSKLCFKNNPILFTAIRHHWNKDFKPAPFPKTDEERCRAAEKYGIHPSEYKPVPDGSCGDYPDFPPIAGDSRSPYYPWDSPELKRNFNEPLHIHFDLIREDRVDINFKWRHSTLVYVSQFLGCLGSAFLIYWLLEPYKMFHQVVPRQYPSEGQKHYTFEQE